MTLTKYIFLISLSLVMFACSSEPFSDGVTTNDGIAYVDGESVVVNFSLQTPEIPNVSTRALAENPDFSDMHLYLLEFADNGDPLDNTLTNVYEAESESPQEALVNYRVTLVKTSLPRILHLVALPKNEKLTIGYGIEASIIPSLKTTNQTPAYWRRLTFPYGYASAGPDGVDTPTAEIAAKLAHVALVRNYACIGMVNNAKGFELAGFAIVNNPESGAIAAWDAENSRFPEFLDNDQKPVSYESLKGTYKGIIPAGTTLSNPDTSPVVADDVNDKYLYERPYNSIHRTYVIIKGKRTDDTEYSYYKLDLGKNDVHGIFRNFNLLRNYKYNVILKDVATKGYASPSEAAQGVTYNNFSFDIELAAMLNISDGDFVVYVNFTTAILTDPNEQTLVFKYRFRDLKASTATYNNEDVNFIGLEAGSVIKSWTKDTEDDKDNWRSVRIVCNPAQIETKVQSFTIVNKMGLGRTINLVLHTKWDLRNIHVFNGTGQNYGGTPGSDGIGEENVAGSEAKAPLTVFFDLPDNLQEAMFPLVFTLEADRQNIENNPIGTLVVSYGQSTFPNVEGRRIKYLKTITWTLYNDLLKADNTGPNGTVIENADGTKTHRVRCRFRTITSLQNLGIPGSVTKVSIKNDNFKEAIVSFKRGNATLP